MKYTDDEIDAAIRRIALTPDGLLLHLYLQQVMMEIPATADPGALQDHNGKRRFALELKARMDRAYSESGSDGSKPGSGLVVVERKPVRYAERRGLGRRVGPYDDTGTGPA